MEKTIKTIYVVGVPECTFTNNGGCTATDGSYPESCLTKSQKECKPPCEYAERDNPGAWNAMPSGDQDTVSGQFGVRYEMVDCTADNTADNGFQQTVDLCGVVEGYPSFMDEFGNVCTAGYDPSKGFDGITHSIISALNANGGECPKVTSNYKNHWSSHVLIEMMTNPNLR